MTMRNLFSARQSVLAASSTTAKIAVSLTLMACMKPSHAAEPMAVDAQAATPRAAAPAPQPATGAPTTAPSLGEPAGLAAIIQGAEGMQNGDALVLAYGQSVTDPQLARVALGLLLTNYYQLRNQAQTAEQAVQAVNEAELRFAVFAAAQNQVIIQQNQTLIQQNQRIIELLERQSTTPAKGQPPTR